MPLPSWLLDAPDERTATACLPRIPQKVARSRWDAPGWRLVGPDHYTTVAVPGYEVDPNTVRALQVFDTTAVLVWRKQRWLMPGHNDDPVTFVHHGIARHVEHPPVGTVRFGREHYLELGAGWRGEPPNVLDALFEDLTCRRTTREGGPGAYIKFDAAALAWCRGAWVEVNMRDYDASARRRRDAHEQRRERRLRDDAEKRRDLDAWVARKQEAGQLTMGDWREYEAKRLGLLSGRRRAMITV